MNTVLLSERLKDLNESGDSGKAIVGLPEQAERLEELLREAALLFRFYEESHRKRGPEHLAKADRNADIASRIETALGVTHVTTWVPHDKLNEY